MNMNENEKIEQVVEDEFLDEVDDEETEAEKAPAKKQKGLSEKQKTILKIVGCTVAIGAAAFFGYKVGASKVKNVLLIQTADKAADVLQKQLADKAAEVAPVIESTAEEVIEPVVDVVS